MTDWVLPYVGVRDQSKGRTFDGADCWGLAMMVYRGELGIELPDYADQYDLGRDSKVIAAIAEREKARLWQRVDDPKPFDILGFRIGGESHVGIWTAPGQMLHMFEISTLARYDADPWAARLMGIYRYAG